MTSQTACTAVSCGDGVGCIDNLRTKVGVVGCWSGVCAHGEDRIGGDCGAGRAFESARVTHD